MNDFCQICGQLCEGEICDTCQYQMDTGDNSDIWDRVQKFDNSEYEIDHVKIDICRYYNCEPDDIMKPGRKQPFTQARHMFLYLLIKRFKFKPCEVVKMLNMDHATANYVCRKFDKKFGSNFALEKVLHLLKY